LNIISKIIFVLFFPLYGIILRVSCVIAL